MLAVVRMRRTRKKLFEVRGRIPARVVNYLKKEYGKELSFVQEDEETLVDVFKTDWHKKISAQITPGMAMRCYRENRGLTQEELAQILAKASSRTFSRQNISDMENGRRSISKAVAKNLASIFGTLIERFI